MTKSDLRKLLMCFAKEATAPNVSEFWLEVHHKRGAASPVIRFKVERSKEDQSSDVITNNNLAAKKEKQRAYMRKYYKKRKEDQSKATAWLAAAANQGKVGTA